MSSSKVNRFGAENLSLNETIFVSTSDPFSDGGHLDHIHELQHPGKNQHGSKVPNKKRQELTSSKKSSRNNDHSNDICRKDDNQGESWIDNINTGKAALGLIIMVGSIRVMQHAAVSTSQLSDLHAIGALAFALYGFSLLWNSPRE